MAETPTRKALNDPDEEKPPRKGSRAVKVGWRIYQQIAAVMAAFGIAALLGHFWDIEWRGARGTIVGVWDITIRPEL